MFRVILLCLISCCSSFMPLKQSESIVKEDQITMVDKKIKENYVRTQSGYYEYGTTDLFSFDFANAIIDYFTDNLGNPFLSITNDEVGQYVIQTNNVYKIYFYNQNSEYQLALDVKNIVLQKALWPFQTSTSGLQPKIYSLIFSNSSPYDRTITFEYTCQRTSSNQLQILGNSFEVSNAISQDIVFPNSARFKLSENGESRDAFIYDLVNRSHNEDYNSGYTQGYNDAYSIGYAGGYNVGHNEGYYEGEVYGYQEGYTNGVNDTQVIGEGTQASIIFGGILDVAFIPVNVFLLMFQYEVFGINIAGLVSGLISIALIIILIRVITGKKLW